ncbi:MAG: hypothetical protein U0271_21855 [Polyangiaceae bacterium]
MPEDLAHRFAQLVCRELHAREVELVDGAPKSDASGAALTLHVDLHDGRHVLAHFDHPLEDRDAALRRLEILVRAFESVLLSSAEPRKRAPVAVSLRAELRALAIRTDAIDAVVVDAHSPIVWASCFPEDPSDQEAALLPSDAKDTLRLVRESHRGVLAALGDEHADASLEWGAEPETNASSEPPSDPTRAKLRLAESPAEHVRPSDPTALANAIDRAASMNDLPSEEILAHRRTILETVRNHPQVALLRKGGHLHISGRDPEAIYIARSFAGIYALVLIYATPFDEIRAERALKDSLPRIERLVLALPPLDPDPVPAGVVALRPRRRR